MNLPEQLDQIETMIKQSMCDHEPDYDKAIGRVFCIGCGKDITDETETDWDSQAKFGDEYNG